MGRGPVPGPADELFKLEFIVDIEPMFCGVRLAPNPRPGPVVPGLSKK